MSKVITAQQAAMLIKGWRNRGRQHAGIVRVG